MIKNTLFEKCDFSEMRFSSLKYFRPLSLVILFKDSFGIELKLKFNEAIDFSIHEVEKIQAFYEIIGSTEYLEEALSRAYSIRPIPENNFREYHMVDDRGNVVVKIVSEEVLKIE